MEGKSGVYLLQFCKYLLGVNKRSTNIAALSELGRMSLCISHVVALFAYWHRLVKESTLLSTNGINSWFFEKQNRVKL
jgi:hypothetical protein